MGAAAYLSAPSDVPLRSVTDVYLWVIRDKSDVWATTMSFVEPTPTGAYFYQAQGGSRWDIGVHVDVVIGVRAGRTPVRYVLVPDIPIISVE